MLEIIALGLGWSLLGISALALMAELVLRLVVLFQQGFIYKPVNRRDFLSKRYHAYLAWIEDWSKPMFRYISIGYRVFNNENKISPVSNNRLGFRSPEFTPPLEDELRVVVLGGSAAWGFGASSNQATISGQLEEIINKDKRLLVDGKRFSTVYNLAQVDGTQTQDILTIIGFFNILKPSIVVSLTGWNELASNMRLDEQVMNDWGFYLADMEGWEPVSTGSNAKDQMIRSGFYWLGRHSNLFSILKESIFPAKSFRRSIPEAVEAGTPIYIRNIENLVRLGQAYGYRHYQFFQPNLYRKRYLTSEESRVIELYDVVRPIHGGKAAGDFYRDTDIYESALKEISKEPAKYGEVLNLESIFREDPDWMHYSLVHCTDQGYRRIAEAIYSTIVSNPR